MLDKLFLDLYDCSVCITKAQVASLALCAFEAGFMGYITKFHADLLRQEIKHLR